MSCKMDKLIELYDEQIMLMEMHESIVKEAQPYLEKCTSIKEKKDKAWKELEAWRESVAKISIDESPDFEKAEQITHAMNLLNEEGSESCRILTEKTREIELINAKLSVIQREIDVLNAI